MARDKKYFLIFAGLIALIYGQTLWGGFVFDDRGILEHQELLSSPSNIIQVASYPYWTEDAGLYRPTSLLSYLLNITVFGTGAWSFHLINLLLYFGIAVLLYLVLKALFKDERLAFIAALIFIVLPIHTEVVANITGRLELLALFFSLLTLWEFSKENEANPWLAGLWALLAIGAKEVAIAVVPLVGLVLLIRRQRLWDRGLVAVILGALVYFTLRFLVLGPTHFLGVETSLVENPLLFTTAPERVATAFSILSMYISKTFVPLNLCSDYSYNQIQAASTFLNAKVIFGLLALLASGFSTLYFIRRKPVLSLASAIFLLSFLPVSNIFFPIGTIAGERLFFFPSLGLAILLALILRSKVVLMWLGVGLVLVYSLVSLNHARVWQSEESLFLNAAECAPRSVLSLSNAGTVYYFKGDYREAEKYLLASQAIKPVYSKGLNNLGLVYWKEGRVAEAEQMYFKALQQKYPYSGVYENLALLYLSQGKYDKAFGWLRFSYDDETARQIIKQVQNGGLTN